MELLYAYLFAAFVFGTIMGSFLNVVVLKLEHAFGAHHLAERSEARYWWARLHQSSFWQSLAGERSRCDSCGRALAWYELVPLVSYLVQGGRCRGCGQAIALRHFAAELLAGVYFAGIFYTLLSSTPLLDGAFVGSALLWTSFFALLFALALFDYATQLIPDTLLYPAGVLVAGWGIVTMGLGWWQHALAALLFFSLFALLWLYSKGQWIGFADAKLAILVGLLFGFSAGFTALAYAFWVGAAVSLALVAYSTLRHAANGLSMQAAVAFGPFMVVGMWLVFITQTNLFQLL